MWYSDSTVKLLTTSKGKWAIFTRHPDWPRHPEMENHFGLILRQAEVVTPPENKPLTFISFPAVKKRNFWAMPWALFRSFREIQALKKAHGV